MTQQLVSENVAKMLHNDGFSEADSSCFSDTSDACSSASSMASSASAFHRRESKNSFLVRVFNYGPSIYPYDVDCYRSHPGVRASYEAMFMELNRIFDDSSIDIFRISEAHLVPDLRCVVYFEQTFHRASIHEFPTASSKKQASVYLVDLGRYAIVFTARIFHLPEQFSITPNRILHFTLVGLNEFQNSGFRNYVAQYELNFEKEYAVELMTQSQDGKSTSAILHDLQAPHEDINTRLITALSDKTVPSQFRDQRFLPLRATKNFTSLCRVRGAVEANWGTERHPITKLEPGLKIRVTFTASAWAGTFVVQPPATMNLWSTEPISKLSKLIMEDRSQPFAIPADKSYCGCLLDGQFFSYIPRMDDGSSGIPVRCRLVSRVVEEAEREAHWSMQRTVRVHLIDSTKTISVPVCQLRPLPVLVASAPYQAALAMWKPKDEKGKTMTWTTNEWEEFTKYSMDRIFKAIVRKIKVDPTTGRTGLLLDLLEFTSEEKLRPNAEFWNRLRRNHTPQVEP